MRFVSDLCGAKRFKGLQAGFTLLELLVVVGIIGILVAIAVPQFTNTKIRASVAVTQSSLRMLAQANMQLQWDTGYYLDNPAADGRKIPGDGFLHMGRGEYTRLTSPVAYLSEIPADPFVNFVHPTATPNLRWHYGTDPTRTIGFVFESVGPDGYPNYPHAAYPGRQTGRGGSDTSGGYWEATLPGGRRHVVRHTGRHVWELFFDNQITSMGELRDHFVHGAARPHSPPIDDAVYANRFSSKHPRPYDPSNGVRSEGDIAIVP